MTKQFKHLLCGALLLHNVTSMAQVNMEGLLPENEIRKAMAERVADLSAGEKKVGIVVGLINSQGTRVFAEGYVDESGTRKPDGNTVFEIASITKVFSGLLLAQMVQSRVLELNAPVSMYLSKDARLPDQKGRQITLLDLATHTSGLPFMPDVTVENAQGLYNYLSSCKLSGEIGKVWDYSNTGYWLMSEAIAKKDATSFEDAMAKRILKPLKLTNTGFKLTPAMQANLATGLDASLQKAPLMVEVPNYKLMPAAGLLYSSANDLLKVLAASMGMEKTSLERALDLSLENSRPISDKKRQALGWIIMGTESNKLIYHDGISAGYAGCIIFDLTRKAGVVVLSNQATDVSDLAHHILDPAFPLANPKIEKRIKVKLDPAGLSKYEGKFRTEDDEVFTVTKRGEDLQLESPADWGLPVLIIHPESESSFFMEELPMKVTFEKEMQTITIYPPRRKDGISAKRMP